MLKAIEHSATERVLVQDARLIYPMGFLDDLFSTFN